MKTLLAAVCVVLFAASTAMADPYMVYSPFGPQPLSVYYPPAVVAPAPVVTYYPSYTPVTTYYPPVYAPAPIYAPAPVVVRRGILRPRVYVARPVYPVYMP